VTKKNACNELYDDKINKLGYPLVAHPSEIKILFHHFIYCSRREKIAKFVFLSGLGICKYYSFLFDIYRFISS
jgi:hypothetical protein